VAALLICWVARIGVAAILGAPDAVHANGGDDDCKGSTDDCVAVGRWNFSVGLGAGVRTNPLAYGKDIPLAVIPQLSYYGKRFFVDNLDCGYTLVERDANTLSLIATPGYDRVYFYRTDLQNFFIGFPDAAAPTRPVVVSAGTPGATKVSARAPRITYLAGPEWTFKYGAVSGQLDALRDATGQNSGDEIECTAAEVQRHAKHQHRVYLEKRRHRQLLLSRAHPLFGLGGVRSLHQTRVYPAIDGQMALQCVRRI
jgi:hypothetical protein